MIWLSPFALILTLLAQAVPAAGQVTVRLEIPGKLKLVDYSRLMEDPDAGNAVGLTGKLKVTVENKSSKDLLLWQPGPHGLVFESLSDKKNHVVIHPCQCLRDTRRPDSLAVPAGSTKSFDHEEWECDSIWTAPPPGKYRLRYKLLPLQNIRERYRKMDRPKHSRVPDCGKAFESSEFWQGALVSEAIEITLKKPKRAKAGR
jgi:hypothetical protein